MNKEELYFLSHLAANLQSTEDSILKLANKISSETLVSQGDALSILAKPTNILTAKSLLVVQANELDILDSLYKF